MRKAAMPETLWDVGGGQTSRKALCSIILEADIHVNEVNEWVTSLPFLGYELGVT